MKGNLNVKTKPGSFPLGKHAVSPDMKLEQTFQRANNDEEDIIGQTKKVSYVMEWELPYNKTLAIRNA